MSFFERLLRRFGLASARRSYHFDEEIIQSLHLIAAREQRPEDEVAADLIQYALDQRQASDDYLESWEALSSREQEVAAMVCLGYTNQDIARLLKVSPETVKSHIRNLLGKFGMQRRSELRQALSHWDFSAWQKRFH